jgi:RNA-binding protein YhbY
MYQDLPIRVRIGKAGLSTGVRSEIATLLKKHATIKIRILKSCQEWYDQQQLINELQDMGNIVERRGHTVVLERGYNKKNS